MGYTPPSDIDIGSSAINRASGGGPQTYINKNNPANASGKITSIEIWADTNLSNCEVATFFVVSGNNLSTRGTHTIGAVTAGSKQTFSGLDITVEAGDYIGLYFTAGSIEEDNAGVGQWWKAGDQIPCTNVLFSLATGKTISLYGIGGDGTGHLTIGDSFSAVDSKVTNVSKALAEAYSIVDSKVTSISRAFSEAFSVVDSWAARIAFNEAFSIADSSVKNVVKQLAEACNVVDSFVNIPRLLFYEVLSIKDSFTTYLLSIWHKVTKAIGVDTKVNKEKGDWTKVDKEKGDWDKIEKG